MSESLVPGCVLNAARPFVTISRLAAVLCLAGCSYWNDRPRYAIAPESAMVSLGQTVQFSVSGTQRVLWGLKETAARDARPPVFPLKVSATGRYLVDQANRPWRIQADSAWLISTEATPEQLEAYLSTRSSQGFNAFYLMAVVHPGGYEDARHAPNDRRGNPPFAKPADFSTAGATPESERYWNWIDTIIDRAAAHNVVVMLAYSYLGWAGGDMGWYKPILAQPNRQALLDWGRWLGNRYRNKPNIIWFALGDFAPPPGSEGALRTRAIVDGIKAAGATQLFMAEADPPDSLPSEHPDFGPVLDQNSFYGYGPKGLGPVYQTADRAWRVTPPKPAWMQEGTYEGENNWGHFSGEPWDTRRARFWSVLAGGTAGDGFGSKDVWLWRHVPKSFSSPGAEYSRYAFDLFAALPWWELIPSGRDPGFAGADLVTSGRGNWGQLDFITAAITEKREWLLAYVPVMKTGERTFSVNLAAMAGPARARWFDPATGTNLAISNGQDAGAMARTIGSWFWIRPERRRAGQSRSWGSTLRQRSCPPAGRVR
jgi:hypothetical protein